MRTLLYSLLPNWKPHLPGSYFFMPSKFYLIKFMSFAKYITLFLKFVYWNFPSLALFCLINLDILVGFMVNIFGYLCSGTYGSLFFKKKIKKLFSDIKGSPCVHY